MNGCQMESDNTSQSDNDKDLTLDKFTLQNNRIRYPELESGEGLTIEELYTV